MERGKENGEKMRKSLSTFSLSFHFLNLSPFSLCLFIFSFSLHFLSNFSFARYFLAIYSQATCRPAASCATLLGVVFQVSEWKLCSQQIRIGLCHLCAMFLCFCALSADKRGKYFSGHRLTFDPLRSGAGVLTRGLDDLSCPGVLVGIQPLKLHSSE